MSQLPELGKGVPMASRNGAKRSTSGAVGSASGAGGGKGLFGARRSKSGAPSIPEHTPAATNTTHARNNTNTNNNTNNNNTNTNNNNNNNNGGRSAAPASRKKSSLFTKRTGDLDVDRVPSLSMEQDAEDMLQGAYVIDVKDIAIGRKLGEGATADVYAATFRGEDVAVKLMRNQTNEEKAALSNELAIHCRFSHENCLRLIGYFATRTSVGIVMERCVSTLQDVSLSRRMALEESLSVALDVARGMQHLHDLKVSHRDLKSANVLLNAHGVAKVADFGLSKATAASYMKSLVGTVSHMPPELLQHKPYKKSADVYSFAMVAWQCLSGELPYKDYTSPLQVVYDVVGLNLRPEIPRGTPPEFARLIEDCWAAEPSQRPTFGEVVARLEDITK